MVTVIGSLSLASWVPELKWVAYGVSSVLLAVLYFRGFSAMHEAVHSTLHPNKKINDVLGRCYGILCFLPFDHWKEIHLIHHQWAGNIEKDPVRKLVLEFRKPPTTSRRVINWLWKAWFPVLAIMQEYVFWSLCMMRFLQKNERDLRRFFSLALPVAAWGAIFAFVSWPVTAFVLVPSIVMYLSLVEVINFPHHMSLPQYEGETKLPLWEQYKISRTCLYQSWFESFVLLNFNYHTEHHLFPTLPWYRLKTLSQRLRSDFIETGYNLSFGHEWIVANRKLTLDEATQATSFDPANKANKIAS